MAVAVSLVPPSEIATDAASSVVAPLVTFNVIVAFGSIEVPMDTPTDELSADSAGTLTVLVKYSPGIPSWFPPGTLSMPSLGMRHPTVIQSPPPPSLSSASM